MAIIGLSMLMALFAATRDRERFASRADVGRRWL